MDYKAQAEKKWGDKAEWIAGNGRYALLAYCDVLTVTLWPTEADAKYQKECMAAGGCGGRCRNEHVICDLESLSAFQQVKQVMAKTQI